MRRTGLKSAVRLLVTAGAVLLSACIFGGEENSPPTVTPGYYRGDHGEATRLLGLESDLILDSSGAFHFFSVDSNAVEQEIKGNWRAQGGGMVWSAVLSSWAEYTGEFTSWDTLAPDTSQLRQVTADGFERLEVSQDAQRHTLLRWVQYQRALPVPSVRDGAYEYLDTVPYYADTVQIALPLTTRYEAHAGGTFVETDFQDGQPQLQTSFAQWMQAGSFLIGMQPSYRQADSTHQYGAWTVYPPEYEKVLNLRNLSDTGFQVWIPWDFTNHSNPYWADFNAAP